jgi:hypothetical protein
LNSTFFELYNEDALANRPQRKLLYGILEGFFAKAQNINSLNQASSTTYRNSSHSGEHPG